MRIDSLLGPLQLTRCLFFIRAEDSEFLQALSQSFLPLVWETERGKRLDLELMIVCVEHGSGVTGWCFAWSFSAC